MENCCLLKYCVRSKAFNWKNNDKNSQVHTSEICNHVVPWWRVHFSVVLSSYVYVWHAYLSICHVTRIDVSRQEFPLPFSSMFSQPGLRLGLDHDSLFFLVIVARHVVAQVVVEPADPARQDALLQLRHHPLLLHLGLVSALHAAHGHRLRGDRGRRRRKSAIVRELAVGDPQAGGTAGVRLSGVRRHQVRHKCHLRKIRDMNNKQTVQPDHVFATPINCCTFLLSSSSLSRLSRSVSC